MLLELKVSQFAIIDNIHILFKNGLNILSGETGAGKSVIIKSLALLMGEKNSSQMVRAGQDQAIVEGLFEISDRPDIQKSLADLGIEAEEQQLLIRRVIRSDDKSRVYINGQLSSLMDLRNLVSPLVEVAGSAPLIEMTGQHENKNLISKQYHLDLLDIFSDNSKTRHSYEVLWKQFKNIEKQITELKDTQTGANQRLDYLEYQKNEIEKLNLVPGEEQKLEEEYKSLKSYHKVSQFLESVELSLETGEDSVLDRINYLIKRSSELSPVTKEISAFSDSLSTARSLLSEGLYVLQKQIGNQDFSNERLEDVESRMSDLRKAQKKFGATVEDILNALQGLNEEIHKIKNVELHILNLEKEQSDLYKKLKILSVDLHKSRESNAKTLSQKINKELKELNMQGVLFSIEVREQTDLSAYGSDEVQFMIQTSVKDIPRPLGKVASGGELSRILLSLKKVIGQGDWPRTYLFDEVDTGVSGETAHRVGQRLKEIAKGQQVICVTHLPQVAVYGDIHFHIQKTQKTTGTHMVVNELNPEQRAQEVARLLSGEKITTSSLKNAKELISMAH